MSKPSASGGQGVPGRTTTAPAAGQQQPGAPHRPINPSGAVTKTSASGPPASQKGQKGKGRSTSRKERSTPTKLRMIRGATVAVILLTSLLTAVLMFSGRGSMTQAAGHTEQLIRMHHIKTLLLQADADATTSFLTGQEATTYVSAIEEASTLVVEASRSQPADQEQLARLNSAIVEYNATASLATANNQQNFPVGAAHLDEAGTQLREEALPVVDSLITTNTHAVEQQTRMVPAGVVLLVLLVPLGFAIYLMIWVARRFKRVVNIGIVGATVAVAASTVVATMATSTTVAEVRSVTDDDLAAAVAIADARSNAYNAQVYQNLSLISQERSAEFNAAWQNAAVSVTQSLRDAGEQDLVDLWQVNETNHRKIRSLDADGDVDGAKKLATSQEVGAAFADFSDSANERLGTNARASTAAFNDSGPRLVAAGVTVSVLGPLAAGLMIWGVGVRLREYQ